MDNKTIAKTLNNNLLRIDRLMFLAAMDAESMEADLQLFLEDNYEENLAEILGVKISPKIKQAIESLDLNEITGWLVKRNKLGFIAKLITPAPDDQGNYSWDDTMSTWVYADTLDEIVEKGVAWITCK